MKKWYDEEYEFTIEVTGFLHGDQGNENFHTGGFWDYPDETQK